MLLLLLLLDAFLSDRGNDSRWWLTSGIWQTGHHDT